MNKKQSKHWKQDKGFLIAATLCLFAIGTLAVITFINAVPQLDNNSTTTTTSNATTTTALPAGQQISGIPDKRTTIPNTSANTTILTSPATVPNNQDNVDLFILPLTNTVIKKYSPNEPLYSKTMDDWRVHTGVDFKGDVGQNVKAIADGKIVLVQNDLMWGGTIVIDHGFGIQSTYCGVTSKVKAGDKVNVGDVIAILADIPCESQDGPHLHLEITSNGKHINPVEAIGKEVKMPN